MTLFIFNQSHVSTINTLHQNQRTHTVNFHCVYLAISRPISWGRTRKNIRDGVSMCHLNFRCQMQQSPDADLAKITISGDKIRTFARTSAALYLCKFRLMLGVAGRTREVRLCTCAARGNQVKPRRKLPMN